MTPLDRWKRMAWRESVGRTISISGGMFALFCLEFDWVGPFSTFCFAVGVALVIIGLLISPPPTWRWGRIPAPIKDPAHEVSMPLEVKPEKRTLPVRMKAD